MVRHPTLVRGIMSTRLVTLRPDDDGGEALARMSDHGVRRLPVVKEVAGEAVLIGILTDRDLRLAANSPFLVANVRNVVEELRSLTVGEMMTRAVVTVFPTAPVGVAARLMIEHKVGGLPVVEREEGHDYLVGIVTRTDLLRHLIALETAALDDAAGGAHTPALSEPAAAPG